MNQAWKNAGYLPRHWPFRGHDGEAVHRSDFASVSDLQERPSLDDTSAKVREITSALKGACVALALAPLVLFARTVAPEDLSPTNTFGEVSPDTVISDFVARAGGGGGGMPDNALVLTNGAVKTKGGTAVTAGDVGALSTATGGVIRFKTYDGGFGLSSDYAVFDVFDMTGYIETPYANYKTWFSVDPYRIGLYRQDDDGYSEDDFVIDRNSGDGSVQIDMIASEENVKLHFSGASFHYTYRPTDSYLGTIRMPLWQLYQQDKYLALQDYYSLATMLDSAVVPPNAPPLASSPSNRTLRSGNGSYTNREEAVASIKANMMTLMTDPVTNFMAEAKDLHYDRTLGVTWRTVIDNGYIHCIAVTNKDITAR